MKSKESKVENNFFSRLFEEAEKDSKFHAETLKIEIAEQIFCAMERKNLNRAQLAEKLGLDKSYISKVLKGNINLTIETIAKIGKELEAAWTIKLEDKPREEISPYKDWTAARIFDMDTSVKYSENAAITV
jgi:transcriptional regulator with XRE-family HTH domain